ncbi:BTB/POZ domain protein, partial [Ostertagia ostertagi]
GVLEISDLDYDVVYELVYYIYCGRCQKDIGDIATDLLIAADKYRLVELKGVLEISDLDYDVVYELVYYIYCGRCQKDIGDIATDLLIAADKYRLVELKNHCEKFLVENLANENVCQLLIIGDLYNAERLQERAVQFILQRPKYITSTPGWDDILKQHPHLVTRIVNHFDKVGVDCFCK